MQAHSVSFVVVPGRMAYAVFRGQKLIFWEAHVYMSDRDVALKNLAGDVLRCTERFSAQAAVLESDAKHDEAAGLKATVKETLRRAALPIFETAEQELFDAFKFPAITDRRELRKIVLAIFPQLGTGRFMDLCLDAAALGLNYETNRFLSI